MGNSKNSIPTPKIATITEAVFENEHPAPNGETIYYYKLTLSNFDEGKIGVMAKNKDKIFEGNQITYTIDRDMKIKLQTVTSNYIPPSSNKSSKSTSSSAYKPSFKNSPTDAITYILGYARDIHVAKIQTTKKAVPLSELETDASQLMDLYMKMREKVEQVKQS